MYNESVQGATLESLKTYVIQCEWGASIYHIEIQAYSLENANEILSRIRENGRIIKENIASHNPTVGDTL